MYVTIAIIIFFCIFVLFIYLLWGVFCFGNNVSHKLLVDALIIMTVVILKTLQELRKAASFGKFSKERP